MCQAFIPTLLELGDLNRQDIAGISTTISSRKEIILPSRLEITHQVSGLWSNKATMHMLATTDNRQSAKPLLLKGNIDLWHQRMAHTHIDTLRHLPEAVTGVKIDDLDENHDFKQPCKDCKLANASQQISRRPMMAATAPLERIHFNLIEMRPGLNGDK